MNGEPDVSIDGHALARKVVVVCVAIEVALVLGDLVFNFGKLVPVRNVRQLFNVAREESFATWFASTQALVVGAVVGAIASLHKHSGAPRWRWIGWAVLASFFVYVAIDDALAIHEKVGSLARKWSSEGLDDRGWFPSYYWQVVFAPLFGGMALLMLWLPWRGLGEAGLRRYMLVGLGCLGAAVAIDFVEGLEGAYERIADALGARRYAVSHLSKVFEELLEMLGTTALLGTFLGYLAHLTKGRRWTIE